MMPRVSRLIAWGLVAGLLLSPDLALAATQPVELQKKARARMKSLDFEAALPLLEQLRELPALTPPVRSGVLVDLGITFVNLGRADDARKAFDEALELNPDVPFPSGVPPKIRRLFDEAKEARLVRLNPPPVAVAPEPVAPKSEPLAPKAEAPPRVISEPSVARPRMVVAPVVLLVGGAAAIGAGVATALAAQSASRELSAGLHSSSEAQALLSRRSSLGMASYVCYGVGAAMAVTGAALFAFSGSRQQVSALVTPSGAALMVTGEF
jgi:tetratricopeptide (TPR) repeat protein